MVIMKIRGGFASQLGKFILGYKVAAYCSTEYLIDIGEFTNGYFRPFELFRLNLPEVKIIDNADKISNLVIVRNGLELIEEIEKDEPKNFAIWNEECDYQVFFEKYPQFEIDYTDEILKRLRLRSRSSYIDSFQKKILNKFSVAVHVRRGDFVTLGWEDCMENYEAGIGYVLSKHSDAIFFFFSNDIEWTKKYFGESEKFIFVEERNGYISDIEDFFAMAMCKMRIVSSNSGFSKLADCVCRAQYECADSIFVGKDGNYKNLYCLTPDEYQKGVELYKKISRTAYTGESCSKCNLITRKEAIDLTKDREKKLLFWREYYDIDKSLKDMEIVLISDETRNPWCEQGLFLVAGILSRIGYRVLYINVNKQNNNRDVISAKNMDGINLGFQIIEDGKMRFLCDKIINTWRMKGKGVTLVCDTVCFSKYKKTKIKKFGTIRRFLLEAEMMYLSDISNEEEIYRVSESDGLNWTKEFCQMHSIDSL